MAGADEITELWLSVFCPWQYYCLLDRKGYALFEYPQHSPRRSCSQERAADSGPHGKVVRLRAVVRNWGWNCEVFGLLFSGLRSSLLYNLFFKPPFPPLWLLLGSPMLMEAYPSQHACSLTTTTGINRSPQATFKPTLSTKWGVVLSLFKLFYFRSFFIGPL